MASLTELRRCDSHVLHLVRVNLSPILRTSDFPTAELMCTSDRLFLVIFFHAEINTHLETTKSWIAGNSGCHPKGGIGYQVPVS